MSNCNHAASEALKSIGYDKQAYIYFDGSGDSIVGEHFNGACFSVYPNCTSRPDHLDAADWLFEKHEISIWFPPTCSFIAKPKEKWFVGENHRDEAIIAACEMMKSKSTGNG